MIRRLVLIIATALMWQYSAAQIPGFGSCPKVGVERNFDVNRYLGLWYEVKKYPNFSTIRGKCVTIEYGLNPNETLSVFSQQLVDDRERPILGFAKQVQPGVGVLGIAFPPFQSELEYYIMETDYDNYAVIYSCSSFLHLVHGKLVWILTRTRFPPQPILDKAYEVMKINGISTSYLATTINEGCPDEISNSIDNFRD